MCDTFTEAIAQNNRNLKQKKNKIRVLKIISEEPNIKKDGVSCLYVFKKMSRWFGNFHVGKGEKFCVFNNKVSPR